MTAKPTVRDRILEHLRANDHAFRGPELDQALKLKPGVGSATCARLAELGKLMRCEITSAAGRKTWEYRYAYGGNGEANFSPLKQPLAGRPIVRRAGSDHSHIAAAQPPSRS